jgi:hypothetical protein
MSKKRIIEDGKIFFYQISANEIIDLGDELSLNEIGYYLIIRNVYIKYFGVLTINKIPKYAKIYKKSEQKRIKNFAKDYLECNNGFIKNKEWDIIIQEILIRPYKIKQGDKHWNWKGGITSENSIIRNSINYRTWRKKVFRRDKYTCQKCNKKGGKLNAHHIKPFCNHKNLRFNIENGMTLCKQCHINEHSRGKEE